MEGLRVPHEDSWEQLNPPRRDNLSMAQTQQVPDMRSQVPVNVNWGIDNRHNLNILTSDSTGNSVILKIEPHYINIDWDNRPYVIGYRYSGWKPPSERNGWVIIFLENIEKCNILQKKFEPRIQDFLSFKKLKEDTFIRPSNFEKMVKD
jgi:hypothetical protein